MPPHPWLHTHWSPILIIFHHPPLLPHILPLTGASFLFDLIGYPCPLTPVHPGGGGVGTTIVGVRGYAAPYMGQIWARGEHCVTSETHFTSAFGQQAEGIN